MIKHIFSDMNRPLLNNRGIVLLITISTIKTSQIPITLIFSLRPVGNSISHQSIENDEIINFFH